jgi:membrane protein implicated in regulation of membrane protease activity
LKALSEIIISFFELAEAEGRELRRNILVLLAVAASFFSAAVMAAAGMLALLFALYRAMSPLLGETASLAAAGAVSASIAIAAAIFGFKYANKDQRSGGGYDELTEEPGEPQEKDAPDPS